MHIHSILKMSNTTYMFDIDIKSILNGSMASINALRYSTVYHLAAGTPNSKGVFGIWADRSQGNVVRTHPYAYPQHMKVVKHFIYVWHRYEIICEWVYSVTQCTTPALSSPLQQGVF